MSSNLINYNVFVRHTWGCIAQTWTKDRSIVLKTLCEHSLKRWGLSEGFKYLLKRLLCVARSPNRPPVDILECVTRSRYQHSLVWIATSQNWDCFKPVCIANCPCVNIIYQYFSIQSITMFLLQNAYLNQFDQVWSCLIQFVVLHHPFQDTQNHSNPQQSNFWIPSPR